MRIVKLLHEAELERANTDREIKGTYPSRGCTSADFDAAEGSGEVWRILQPAGSRRAHRRSSTRTTCVGDHSPDPRAVGMPCVFNPSAMARSVAAPASCSALIVGAISAARIAARSCGRQCAAGEPNRWRILRAGRYQQPERLIACVRSAQVNSRLSADSCGA